MCNSIKNMPKFDIETPKEETLIATNQKMEKEASYKSEKRRHAQISDHAQNMSSNTVMSTNCRHN